MNRAGRAIAAGLGIGILSPAEGLALVVPGRQDAASVPISGGQSGKGIIAQVNGFGIGLQIGADPRGCAGDHAIAFIPTPAQGPARSLAVTVIGQTAEMGISHAGTELTQR